VYVKGNNGMKDVFVQEMHTPWYPAGYSVHPQRDVIVKKKILHTETLIVDTVRCVYTLPAIQAEGAYSLPSFPTHN